jgi:hypothetical protein
MGDMAMKILTQEELEEIRQLPDHEAVKRIRFTPSELIEVLPRFIAESGPVMRIEPESRLIKSWGTWDVKFQDGCRVFLGAHVSQADEIQKIADRIWEKED